MKCLKGSAKQDESEVEEVSMEQVSLWTAAITTQFLEPFICI